MRIIPALIATLLWTAAAAAQVPIAVLVEGQALPGGPGGHLVGAISNSGVNHAAGFAFTVNSSDGVLTLSHVWGAATGGMPVPLFSEGTYGQYEQTSFESFFGIDDGGAAAYSPICNDLDTGQTGLDCVWANDLPVAVEGQEVPSAPGWYYSFNSRAGILGDGTPVWVAGLSEIQGGGTDLRALMRGLDAQIVLMGGDTLPGLPWPVEATSIDFDYRFSAAGGHWICPVNLDTGSSLDDGYVVLDGEALQIAGAWVAEGSPVPAEAGGLEGENWDNFDLCGVNEAGGYLITGDTDGPTDRDEFVLLDGEIVLREGDPIGDLTVSGAIEGAYLNEDGDWAVVWDVLEGGDEREALIFNGRLVLEEGDEVDFDGDGAVDPGVVITGFTGISALTLGDRDGEDRARVGFTAEVEAPGFVPPRRALPVADPEEAGLETRPAPRGDRVELECGFLMELDVATAAGETPLAARLEANHPNPFNPRTRIEFSLPREGPVRLDVLSADGRRVATLVDGRLGAGRHETEWTGIDTAGRPAASGVYLYRLRIGSWEQTRRMVLLK